MTQQQNSANEHRRAQKQSQSFADRAYKEALDMQKRQTEREAYFAQTALGFLQAEVITGLTLSRIAADSRAVEKSDRNRGHARQAYDKVVKYRSTAANADSHALEALDAKIAELREQLQSLGETFLTPRFAATSQTNG